MEKNNVDMEDLMKMKELVDMQKCEKDNEKKCDKQDKNSQCGNINIFTKNVYLSINCNGAKW
ncbi:hypothetical protein ACQX0N_00415 [Clostridium tepidum]|jgi:hypothetical protein|uniref:Uncharacterized protein n=1 Tax=Clostridium tepidum TaxID=1962263 RepID=A0A1S9I1Y9_9CLOT|nr:hypothetical protein [Clostridium tepidum]MCR1934814.1 hypothetical protein [Clostridium tepidum]MDU6878349.1 hypothetical protein [Clostridium botulinum]OOO62139.1 hypothetical protein BS637_08415 [Clostridium tepidum]OOO64334.1 hypothetical protein BS638_11045 [Clostridium tepidum]